MGTAGSAAPLYTINRQAASYEFVLLVADSVICSASVSSHASSTVINDSKW